MREVYFLLWAWESSFRHPILPYHVLRFAILVPVSHFTMDFPVYELSYVYDCSSLCWDLAFGFKLQMLTHCGTIFTYHNLMRGRSWTLLGKQFLYVLHLLKMSNVPVRTRSHFDRIDLHKCPKLRLCLREPSWPVSHLTYCVNTRANLQKKRALRSWSQNTFLCQFFASIDKWFEERSSSRMLSNMNNVSWASGLRNRSSFFWAEGVWSW